jgi:hypothetical protein
MEFLKAQIKNFNWGLKSGKGIELKLFIVEMDNIG